MHCRITLAERGLKSKRMRLLSFILFILGVLCVIGVFAVGYQPCGTTLASSALLGIPSCGQTDAETLGVIFLAVIFFIASIVVVVKGRKAQTGQNVDLDFLTDEGEPDQTIPARRSVRQTLLAYGSYALDESTIDAKVTKVSPAAYALGVEKGGGFYVELVGRSDADIRPVLKEHIGKYSRFKFEYFDTPEAAFIRECELYHRFNQPGRLANGHPTRSTGTNVDFATR